jgi:hypothetical protein
MTTIMHKVLVQYHIDATKVNVMIPLENLKASRPPISTVLRPEKERKVRGEQKAQ